MAPWSSEAVNAAETTAWVRETLMHLGVSPEATCTFSSELGLQGRVLRKNPACARPSFVRAVREDPGGIRKGGASSTVA